MTLLDIDITLPLVIVISLIASGTLFIVIAVLTIIRKIKNGK